ncbi:unnamed protein product [Ascophyllum nodosum]
MKPSTVVMASLLGILTGTVVVTEAGWNQISINDSGINFTVRRYDDGRAVPYQLIFKANNIKSTYDIRVDGSVHLLKAGKEKYEVRYNGDGSIKKVVRQDNGARMLWHDELDKEDFSALEDPIDEDIPLEDMFSTEYRRLTSSYACEDCEEAWDVVCGPALAYICELTGNAVLGTAGAQSVEIACDQFGNLCDSLSADEACKGHCVEDVCNPNPCLNRGICTVDPAGGHLCDCASGYGGMACQTDTSSLASFYIQVVYVGTWTAERQAVFQSAADRWAEVITNVPCGGTTSYPAGRLLIAATLDYIDGLYGTLGFAGPSSVWSSCPTISPTGAMTFDIDDIAYMEDRGIFEGVILHEMGHVIGIGTLWGNCSTCNIDGSSDWKCPAVIEVYNDLLGNPGGTESSVIETDGGSGTVCSHFDEIIFDDELMTGYVATVMPLSKITAASLDDTDYIVDPSMVDAYTLPAFRSSISDESGLYLSDHAVSTKISLIGDDGEEVGEIDGFLMEF